MFAGLEDRPQNISAIYRFFRAHGPRNDMYPPPEMPLLVAGIVEDVSAIRSRGGNVIFVRYPTTGFSREVERQLQPRAECWDRVIEATGCLGIHFEDHEELKDFDCPEGSHLTQSDAIKFTRRLYAVIKRENRQFPSPEKKSPPTLGQ